MAKKKKKKSGAKKTRKTNKRAASSREAAPSIRSSKDLVAHISKLAAEFTGSHQGVTAITGGSTLLDSRVDRWIPTGCPNFDAMLQGGFPCGRITQIFGNESTGKSTLVQSAMIQCEKMGGVSIYIDPEAGFDPIRYERMGGNPDAVILLQKEYDPSKAKSKKTVLKGIPSMSIQDVFKYINDILNGIVNKPEWKGCPVFVGLDSLDNVTTDEALAGDSGGMTLKPRLIREGFRHITIPVARLKACFVIVSQTIENIKQYGAGQTTAGGGGPKFISSVRVNTKKLWVGDNDFYTKQGSTAGSFTGNALIRSLVIKNKLNRPYTEAVTAINNDSGQALEGVDPPFSLLYGLLERFVVSKPGSAYRYLKVKSVDPEVDAQAVELGLQIDQEYPFIMSQWRQWIAQYPAVLVWLEKAARSLYRRPEIFKPETPDESDQEHAD